MDARISAIRHTKKNMDIGTVNTFLTKEKSHTMMTSMKIQNMSDIQEGSTEERPMFYRVPDQRLVHLLPRRCPPDCQLQALRRTTMKRKRKPKGNDMYIRIVTRPIHTITMDMDISITATTLITILINMMRILITSRQSIRIRMETTIMQITDIMPMDITITIMDRMDMTITTHMDITMAMDIRRAIMTLPGIQSCLEQQSVR